MKLLKITSALLALILVSASFALTSFAGPSKTVKQIIVPDVVHYEYTDGEVKSEYGWDGVYRGQYFRYHETPSYATVKFTDGSEATVYSDWDCYAQLGSYWTVYSDQSIDEQWGVGEHTAHISILSFEADFTVRIVKGNVKSLKVDPITMYENIDGYRDAGYNFVTGDVEEFFRYNNYFSAKVTATLDDGTVVDATYGVTAGDNNSYAIMCGDDQSVYNKWGVGDHTATAYLLGAKCDFKITILPNPLSNVVFHDVTLIKGINSSEYNGVHTFSYNASFTAYFKDGTVLESKNGAVSHGGLFIYGYVFDDQEYGEWQPGDHLVSANVGGFWGTFNVKVLDNPYVGIEIFEGEDNQLYVRFMKPNGTYDSEKIEDFAYSDMYNGMINTRVTIAGNSVTALFDCGHDEAFRPLYESYVYMVIGNFTSNTLKSCGWLKRNMLLPRYAGSAFTYLAFDPTFKGLSRTSYKVDEFVTLACNMRDLFYLRNVDLENFGGFLWGRLSVEDVAEAVNYIFGVSVDVTKYSYYDPSAPSTVPVPVTGISEFLKDTNLTPEGLTWKYSCFFTDDLGKDTEVDFELEFNYRIKNIRLSQPASPTRPGDANGDGRVDMKDVLLMRKHILNIQKILPANFANADMDGDGVIRMSDVLAVRKKILHID